MTARIYQLAAARPREASDQLPASPPASSNVRPIRDEAIARVMNDREMIAAIDLRQMRKPKPDLDQLLANAGYRMTLGERLVGWFRAHGDLFVAGVAGAAFGMLLMSAAAFVIAEMVL